MQGGSATKSCYCHCVGIHWMCILHVKGTERGGDSAGKATSRRTSDKELVESKEDDVSTYPFLLVVFPAMSPSPIHPHSTHFPQTVFSTVCWRKCSASSSQLPKAPPSKLMICTSRPSCHKQHETALRRRPAQPWTGHSNRASATAQSK